MNSIRTAVIGAGKMGSIHARVYDKLENAELIAIVDTDLNKAQKLADNFNCRAVTDPSDIIGKVDAVTISAPTVCHCELAKLFIENGISVLIEKPLAASVEEGRKIVELSQKHKVIAAVGHSERCNPVVQAMKRLHIEPKYIQANRISPYPFRSTDIGVVLDVMIHDIDIILSLAGSKVKSVDAIGVNVIGEHEDICNARIFFENNCVANVTASRLAIKTERKVRVFSRQAYLSLDFFKKEGLIIQADPNTNAVEWIREKQKEEDFDFSEVNWTEMLNIEQLDIQDAEPLTVEQQSFLQAVSDQNCRPEVTAEEGLAAMECADMILKAIQKHSWD